MKTLALVAVILLAGCASQKPRKVPEFTFPTADASPTDLPRPGSAAWWLYRIHENTDAMLAEIRRVEESLGPGRDQNSEDALKPW